MPTLRKIKFASIDLQNVIRNFHGLSFSAMALRYSPAHLLQGKQHSSPFSSTSEKYFPRDMNRERGVSTSRRTGLRQPVSVSKTPLPKPVLDPSRHSKYKVPENHGLWGFFHSKEKAINTPQEDVAFGRSWTVDELRGKRWEDLHALWWVCAKENNRIATASYERQRINAGYGEAESEERDKAVRRTKRAIKQVLTERWYSWIEARSLANNDTEINLSGDGLAYCPKSYLEDSPNELNLGKEIIGKLPVVENQIEPKESQIKST